VSGDPRELAETESWRLPCSLLCCDDILMFTNLTPLSIMLFFIIILQYSKLFLKEPIIQELHHIILKTIILPSNLRMVNCNLLIFCKLIFYTNFRMRFDISCKKSTCPISPGNCTNIYFLLHVKPGPRQLESNGHNVTYILVVTNLYIEIYRLFHC